MPLYEYNFDKITQLLQQLPDDQFEIICYDHFQKVYKQFKPHQKRTDRIELFLMRYRQSIPQIRQLLAIIENEYTTRYKQAGPYQEISFSGKAEFVDALLACEVMSNPTRRNTLVNNLPSAIRNNITRDPTSTYDVTNIVDACLQYHGGLDKLIEIIRFFEKGSLPQQKVETMLVF